MRVTVANVITVENPTKDVLAWCRDVLTLNNPEYAKKVRMHYWLGNTPKTISLYEMRAGNLILPFGTLREFAVRFAGQIEWVNGFAEPVAVDYGADIPLYDYQEKAVEAMVKAGGGILQSPAGSGKGLPLSAKIYTPAGFKRNGDLEVGDVVCNSYGGSSKVTAIYDRGVQPMYKVTFTDDVSIVCDSDHLWKVRDVRAQSKWKEMSAKEIYEHGIYDAHGNRRFEIPVAEPVNFLARPVSIDPWLLGVLIGDGCLAGCSVELSNPEPDIVSRVASLIAPGNLRKEKGDNCDWFFADGGVTKHSLSEYGLFGKRSWEKFIPDEYKYNSVDVRLGVLQGVMDTDGSVGKSSNITVTTTSRKLASDLLEIVQSLGGTGRISIRHTNYTYNGEKKCGRESYRLSLKLYKFTPYTSEKHTKNGDSRTKYTNAYRRIKEIVPIQPQETRCITVDSNDHCYLTDGFVVTHNTQAGISLIAKTGQRALWLCNKKDLITQSYERAKLYMDESLLGIISDGKVNIGKGITFATVQTLCRVDLNQYKDFWSTIVVDEVHGVAGSPTTLTMYQKVLNSLSARHKYGLSATVHRSDGMIEATYALIGHVRHIVPDAAVGDKIMKVGICPVQTGTEISNACLNTDGTLNYTSLIGYLTTNYQRTQVIIDKVVENRGKSCLILSDRLEHLATIMNALPDDMWCDSVMISGKMTTKKGKAEREQAIEDMRTGDKKYMFATYSLCKEGLDIPRLERLFMASPVKDYAVVTQSIGRIARVFNGKADPVCYDFVDSIGFLERAYKKRCSTYKKNGCYWIEEG